MELDADKETGGREGGKNREIWSLMQMEREEEKWSLTRG